MACVAEIPSPVVEFVARQLGRRVHEVASSEPTRAVLRVAEIPEDPRIAELARDDCYFRGSPRVEVTWDATTGDILHWTCDPAAREFGALSLKDDEAIEAILQAIQVPRDRRVFRRAVPTRKFAAHLLTAEWTREVDGIEVSGDYAEGVVNVTTGRIVSFSRGPWHPLPEFGPALPLEEARRIADAWSADRGFDPKLAWNPSRRIGWHEPRYVRTWDLTYERETGELETPSADSTPEVELPECVHRPDEPPVPRRKIEYASVSVDDAGRILE